VTGRNVPTPALGLALLVNGALPPPFSAGWFVPVESPACGAELRVLADATNDGIERRFLCDRVRGHDDHAVGGDRDREMHRQVVDNQLGRTVTWVGGAAVT
jgi:hypothetical protein